ncbi:abortive infection system antitoxin AbiGi family protein [Pseudomonas koreensis]|uniref:abortive infection system antitoxin AbiGi family protein n=1 Tax=Pseudomonas koreensis TaxID=198620 RepID=UPI0021CA4729|nr:abortive infection system antitoxin AbiGi family protein [Pseudomonas koreensis]MCU0092192.1 abortive infection system antitoxin AbiGi family protein [Pseudomonas koreensis]
MSLSSNSIIHLTKTREALEGILTDNFRIKYCKETIRWKKGKSVIHVPMVSFCDIPLSQIKDHISNYGFYGIGLTREWAIRNFLNPVLYIEPNSNLAHSFEQAILQIAEMGVSVDAKRETVRRLADVTRYIKNYEGLLERKNEPGRTYRFSDEREWRYVPEVEHECKMLYLASEFNKDGAADAATDSVAELRLSFEPDDIKYIIIKNDSEISDIINHLRKAKGANFTLSSIERLTTRILTSEQILTDI